MPNYFDFMQLMSNQNTIDGSNSFFKNLLSQNIKNQMLESGLKFTNPDSPTINSNLRFINPNTSFQTGFTYNNGKIDYNPTIKNNSVNKQSTSNQTTNVSKSNTSSGAVGNAFGTISNVSNLVPKYDYGNSTTNNLNTGYDAAANAAMTIPGWGTIIGGIMKVGGGVIDGINNATDGALAIKNAENTADKILSSKWLALTPKGVINSLTKKKVEGTDKELYSSINRGYNPGEMIENTEIGGVTNWFSKTFLGRDRVKERTNKANRANIDLLQKNANLYQDDLNKKVLNNTLSTTYLKNQNQLAGFNRKNKNNLISAKKGTKIEPITFENFRKSLPKQLQDTVYYRLEDFWNLNGKPLDYKDAVNKKLIEDGHMPSVAYDESKDEYLFLKVPSHPTVGKELDWYDSDDARDFRNKYELNKNSSPWKYVRKHKEGGVITQNVIPDGAFHSRKNNLPEEIAKHVTPKGIPVISKEGGEIVQHAEVEKNEVIFHIKLTNKLEQLHKKYNETKDDKYLIEAGKILCTELLENTIDNTGLIDKIE